VLRACGRPRRTGGGGKKTDFSCGRHKWMTPNDGINGVGTVAVCRALQ